MKFYEFAIVVTIPADKYEDAVAEAEEVAENLGMDAGIGVSLELNYEHDNDGQRVLYLHPEDKPLDED